MPAASAEAVSPCVEKSLMSCLFLNPTSHPWAEKLSMPRPLGSCFALPISKASIKSPLINILRSVLSDSNEVVGLEVLCEC